MNVLMDVQTLTALPRESVLPIDCRFTLSEPDQGERGFLQAHIPGAAYANLDRDLSDLSKQGLSRHPLPDAPAFARTLSSWGWHPGLRVVAYDAAGGAMAAVRLWWMLASVGITSNVLDGGWQAWQTAGLPVESGVATMRAPTSVTSHFDSSRVVDYVFAFIYNSAGIPLAAGLLYLFFGLLLSPVVAAAAMSLSPLNVVSNALRLRGALLAG